MGEVGRPPYLPSSRTPRRTSRFYPHACCAAAMGERPSRTRGQEEEELLA